MASSTLNENDILKALVRRGLVADLCKELNTQMAGSSPSPKPILK